MGEMCNISFVGKKVFRFAFARLGGGGGGGGRYRDLHKVCVVGLVTRVVSLLLCSVAL